MLCGILFYNLSTPNKNNQSAMFTPPQIVFDIQRQSLRSGSTKIGTSSPGQIASNRSGLVRLHSMSLVVSSLSI